MSLIITNEAAKNSQVTEDIMMFGSWRHMFELNVLEGSLLKVSQGSVRSDLCSKIPSSCDGQRTDG